MVSELEESAAAAKDLIMEELHMERAHSKWTSQLAFSSMIMALLAAVSALLAGITANDSMIQRTTELLEASRLNEIQLSIEVAKSKHEILTSLGKSPDDAEVEKFRASEAIMKANMEIEESRVEKTVYEHELFAIGTTLLSMAITLSGLSIVTRRRSLWSVGLVFSAIGVGFVGWGVYTMIT